MALPKCVCGDNKVICLECIEAEYERLTEKNRLLRKKLEAQDKAHGNTAHRWLKAEVRIADLKQECKGLRQRIDLLTIAGDEALKQRNEALGKWGN